MVAHYLVCSAIVVALSLVAALQSCVPVNAYHADGNMECWLDGYNTGYRVLEGRFLIEAQGWSGSEDYLGQWVFDKVFSFKPSKRTECFIVMDETNFFIR